MINFPSNPALGQSFNSLTGGIYTWDGMAWSLVNSGFDRWATRGIGEIYMVNTAMAGVDIPPVTTDASVWIELTAGLTGAGAFNNGKLTTESVTGSAPLVLATAVVALAGSPMNGQTVDLINTENRILRPSATAGTKQNDAMQPITGSFNMRNDYPASPAGAFTLSSDLAGNRQEGASTTRQVIFNSALVTRTDTETRMKNVSVKAYMRIK